MNFISTVLLWFAGKWIPIAIGTSVLVGLITVANGYINGTVENRLLHREKESIEAKAAADKSRLEQEKQLLQVKLNQQLARQQAEQDSIQMHENAVKQAEQNEQIKNALRSDKCYTPSSIWW